MPVLEYDRAVLESDHGAAEAGAGILHDQVELRVYLRNCLAAAPVPRQYVLPIHALAR
ncbi:hypothetical protein GCM10023263_18980 [Phytohabitans rumicis]